MKYILCAAAFLLPFAAPARQAPAPATSTAASDTAVYRQNRYISFLPGTLRLLDGRTIQGFMPIPTLYPGIGTNFIYYLTDPQSKPKPKKQKMEITRVHSLTAGTHYLETMLLPDGDDSELYDPEILAERFVNGPVELFLQAEEQRIPVPIPVAGSLLNAAIPYTNSHFFVRRNGLLMQVGRGEFKQVMSHYLQDHPVLAAKVREGEKNYHYQNLIAIITEYNAHIGSKSDKTR